MNILLAPASEYSIEELAGFYNETRVDYLVPMPMNGSRLTEYIRDFDVHLGHSVVVLCDGNVSGLGMLGVRSKSSWITRLGVLPQNRRRGIGDSIIDSMLNTSRQLGMSRVDLEVIKGNEQARRLFEKHGFEEAGEYVVLRRAPVPLNVPPLGKMIWLDRNEALSFVQSSSRQTWINAFRSMSNAEDVNGMYLVLGDGSKGWVIFRKKIPTLTHIILHTESGNPRVVGESLLRHLHYHHPRLDTYAENILAVDPHLPAFLSMGYFEAFRRIEMICRL